MKITKVECTPLLYKNEEPFYNGVGILGARGALLVRIFTDEGICGIGEACAGDGPMSVTINVIEKELAPLIVGEDPLMTEWLWNKCYFSCFGHGRGGIVICALSGIDMALWDVKGKYFGAPLYKLLGGHKTQIAAYASAGFYRRGDDAMSAARELKAYVEEGFRAVKMKVGRTHTPLSPIYYKRGGDFYLSFEEDLERVANARKLLGPGITLMVDANAAWDRHHALAAGKFFEEQGVYLFEEPTRTEDYETSRFLNRHLGIKIAGYETEQLLYNFARLIDRDCVSVVQPDIAWAGGITETKKIADYAAAHYKECAPHAFGSAVLMAATVHLCCALPNAGMIEFDKNINPLRDDLLKTPIRPDREGKITVGEDPGLGVELNDDVVEKYRLTV